MASDYILRIVEQIAAMLATIIAKKQAGQFAEAGAELENTSRKGFVIMERPKSSKTRFAVDIPGLAWLSCRWRGVVDPGRWGGKSPFHPLPADENLWDW
jgi:hypothetical protein